MEQADAPKLRPWSCAAKDSRGRRVAVVRRAEGSKQDGAGGAPKDRPMSTRQVAIGSGVLVLCIVAGFTLLRLKSGGLGRAYDVPDWAFGGLFGVVLGVLAWSVWPGRVGRTIARGRVARGCCGSCGYWLQGLRAQGDGCTVCPECGSAWRLAEKTGE